MIAIAFEQDKNLRTVPGDRTTTSSTRDDDHRDRGQ